MTPDLATKIAQRLLDEWDIGSSSRFCDDAPDYESASCEEIAAVICEVASESEAIDPDAATGCADDALPGTSDDWQRALTAFKTKETLHTIEFIGDGNAIFRFTGGTEHLIPAGDAAAHWGFLLGQASWLKT